MAVPISTLDSLQEIIKDIPLHLKLEEELVLTFTDNGQLDVIGPAFKGSVVILKGPPKAPEKGLNLVFKDESTDQEARQ